MGGQPKAPGRDALLLGLGAARSRLSESTEEGVRRLGPRLVDEASRLSEGLGLFRVTGSFVSSGHLVVGSPGAQAQGAHILRRRQPRPKHSGPGLPRRQGLPAGRGLRSMAPVSPPLSEQRQGQPGHREEVMQWERTWPLSPIDLGSAANLQCDLGWLTSHP